LQPTLYALNVGRGDSFFVEIPAESGSFVVLIDGGDHFIDERVKPLRFIQEKGWERIDLMIVTHLHPDHVIGLLAVAEQIPVREAVIPYPEFSVRLGEMRHPKAVQTAALFRYYGQLCELLRRQHTRVTLRPPFGGRASWRFGEYVLRHLDPIAQSDMPAYEIIERLLSDSLPVSAQEKLCAAFDARSNADSSVWLLEQANGPHLFLFGGDALLPNWERIAERETLRPRGFKVGHHGMVDAWNERLLRLLSPDWILITNHGDEYRYMRDAWLQLAQSSQSRLFVTGSQPKTHYLESRLPAIPERIELE
jgi:beta-lactamase superfamily II metal-dependent hydrolase